VMGVPQPPEMTGHDLRVFDGNAGVPPARA